MSQIDSSDLVFLVEKYFMSLNSTSCCMRRSEGVFGEPVPVTMFLCFFGSPVNPRRKFWARLFAASTLNGVKEDDQQDGREGD